MDPIERLSIPEVARVLGIKVARAYELTQRRELASLRIGGRVFVTGDALREFIARGGSPRRRRDEVAA